MLPKCSQNVTRMLLECSQNVVISDVLDSFVPGNWYISQTFDVTIATINRSTSIEVYAYNIFRPTPLVPESSLATNTGGASVHAGCSVFDIGASLVYAGAEFDFDDGGDVYVGDSVCI